MNREAVIVECGNGLPTVGDYVPGAWCLYRVLALHGSIQTGRAPGQGNWILATVAEADWCDCHADDAFPARVEDDAFPARVEIEGRE